VAFPGHGKHAEPARVLAALSAAVSVLSNQSAPLRAVQPTCATARVIARRGDYLIHIELDATAGHGRGVRVVRMSYDLIPIEH